MRKLLLASAAIMGATTGLAMAQGASNQLQGQYVGPYGIGPSYGNFNSGSGSLQNVYGSAAAGGLSGNAFYSKAATTIPTPGNVVIRLNGKVEADFAVGATNLDKGTIAGVNYKLNPVNIGSYMRLYPSFDGMSANGIRYGAQIELRENFQPATSAASTSAAASPSVNASAETVFVRRAFTYIASDSVGIVRLGQGDGLIGLFDPCIFTSQCWDAGVGVFQNAAFGGFFPTNAFGGGATNYPWLAQAGAEYGNNKIAYLTPQFFGFDFGFQYAPNQGNAYQNSSPGAAYSAAGTPSSAGAGNPDTFVSATSGDIANRWINEWGVGGRYQHTFGAVDVKAYGVYLGTGHESSPLSAEVDSFGYKANNFDNIGLYQFGAAVTTAGLTAAVTYQGGQVTNQLGLLAKGGKSMSATVLGLTYLTGPWTAGATVGMIDAQGSDALVGVSQRHQFEVAVGGNYKLAPGINLVLQYDYYQTHQGDYNFLTGATGTATAPQNAYNDTHAQAVMFSTMLTW